MLTQYPAGLAFAFGETTVIPARRELVHRGERVNVGNRAFDLLLLLLEQHGVVVSKDRIMEVVWARRVVGENTLEGQMSILRRALGYDRTAIRTIAGRGYQFVGELQQISATPDASAPPPDPIGGSAPVPPVRSNRLPALVSPLIGRQTELDEVTALLRTQRLVTLVGAGGVGKTRLAIEAARAAAGSFDDGVYLAELAATASGDFVPSVMAVALGFPPGEGTQDLEKISPRLRERHFLLVVDNCEHLVDSAAGIVETLLQIAPGATVLATSRESLRIPGEYVYRVPSLDIPSEEDDECACRFGAVQLLRERIGSGSFASDERTALAIMARICRRLDGIPLAIELAAACTPSFGLQGVAERLDDRFQLFRHGARTALPRQQTLRAAVDWSYAMLPDAWKTALNRLSLFADAFTLESAQQMIGGDDISDDEVTLAVVELVNKSLLCTISGTPHTRYRLLETIRVYAREKLWESGVYREWSARHARHLLHVFLAAEQSAAAHTGLDWAQAYGPHFADLRAAVAWSFSPDGDMQTAVELTVASIAPSMRTGLVEECLGRVDAALAALPQLAAGANPPSQVDIDRWAMKLHAARGACLLFRNAGHPAAEAFAAALELAGRNGDVEYRLRGLWGNWSCAHLDGRPDEALSPAAQFAEIALQSPRAEDRRVARRLTAIGSLCLGELDAARAQLEQLRALCATTPRAERIRFLYDERMLVQAAFSQSLSLLGLHEDALREAQRSLDDARELAHTSSICYALSEAVCPAALLAEDHERLEEAVQALGDATRRHGVSTWKFRAGMWRGLLALRAGRADAYDTAIAPALAAIGNARYSVVLIPFLAETAIGLARHGRTDPANALLDQAIEWAQRTNGALALPELRRARAETLLCDPANANADIARAKSILQAVVRISRQRGFIAWALRGETSLNRLRERGGDREVSSLLALDGR